MFLFQQVVSLVTSVPLAGVNATKNAAKWSWNFTQGILQSLPVKTIVSITVRPLYFTLRGPSYHSTVTNYMKIKTTVEIHPAIFGEA